MKKTGWMIGIIVFAVIFVVFAVLTILNINDKQNERTDLSQKDMIQTTTSAIQAFCAGVYYTNSVLDANVQYDTYDAWQADLDKALVYYETAGDYTRMLAETDTLMGISQHSSVFSFVRTAYAAESSEMIQIFDSAQAGHRLKALADFLNADMAYAQSALKMANGDITADAWDNYGDVAASRETAARALRSGCKVTVLAAVQAGTGVPAIPFMIPSGVVSLGGAATAVQLTDDAAFIFMGEAGYDNCTYTLPALTSGTMGAVKNSAEWLFMSSSGEISAHDSASDIRTIVKTDPFVGIDIQGNTATMTCGDLNDAIAYAQALKDGESLLDEILALQNLLAAGDSADPSAVSTPESAFPILEGRFVDTRMGVHGDFYEVIEFSADGTCQKYSVGVSGDMDEITSYQEGTYTIEPASDIKDYVYYVTTSSGSGYHIYTDDIAENEVISLFQGQYKKD